MRQRRPGFTVLETIIAIGVLASAAVLVAQTGTWSLYERVRTEERLAAMEAAANELETARAQPWEGLTPEWAATRKTPDNLATQLLDVELTVHVVREADRPRVKRVTVDVKWTDRSGKGAPPITLTGLFADRSAGGSP